MSALALLLLLALATLTLAGLLLAAKLLTALLTGMLLTALSAARLLATLSASELLPALSSTSALATNFRLLSVGRFLPVLFLLLLRMLQRFVFFFLPMFILLEFFSHVETSFGLVAGGRMARQDGPLRWMRQNRKYCWSAGQLPFSPGRCNSTQGKQNARPEPGVAHFILRCSYCPLLFKICSAR